jgi:hypothetical protein
MSNASNKGVAVITVASSGITMLVNNAGTASVAPLLNADVQKIRTARYRTPMIASRIEKERPCDETGVIPSAPSEVMVPKLW